MTAMERFFKYVSYDTRSNEDSTASPSTPGQRTLGEDLVAELSQMGLQNPHMDEYGYVYAWLPPSPGCEGVPCVGLIAHMDTSPDVPGGPVRPRVVHYQGGDIPLDPAGEIRIEAARFPSLARYVGQDLIVTDGTTLLGADDKAGIAEILTAVEYLATHPELPHGRVAVAITPDEEMGRGVDHFQVETFGAATAYTVDGGELGEIEGENFNAASAQVIIHGVNVHPGEAKDRMKNALLIALDFAGRLPPEEIPSRTEGYEGFFHLHALEGNETTARLSYLIRDFDEEDFQARKDLLSQVTQDLNDTYGPGTVELELRDQYYNMRPKIEPHSYLLLRAAAAMRAAGVEPVERPIRGGTDGAQLSYRGLPCPNLSTGGLNFHSIYEYLPVEALERMSQVLIHLLTDHAAH